MARAVSGIAIGALAAALAGLGHVAGGGAAEPVLVAILMLASALVFAAASEVRAPLWALAGLGALVQIAGHLLLAPLGGHSGAGGHAHGMPGQAAQGELDAAVSHLASGGATMIAMHAVAFIALLAVVALTAPLAGLLVSLVRVLAPAAIPVASVSRTATPRTHSDLSVVLRHVLVRRGPPAFV
jgi:hypothetical protein